MVLTSCWLAALQNMERECTRATDELAAVLTKQDALTAENQRLSQVRNLTSDLNSRTY